MLVSNANAPVCLINSLKHRVLFILPPVVRADLWVNKQFCSLSCNTSASSAKASHKKQDASSCNLLATLVNHLIIIYLIIPRFFSAILSRNTCQMRRVWDVLTLTRRHERKSHNTCCSSSFPTAFYPLPVTHTRETDTTEPPSNAYCKFAMQ